VAHYVRFILAFVVIINVDKVSLLLSRNVSQPCLHTHASVSKYTVIVEGGHNYYYIMKFKSACPILKFLGN
jgi:hypothetical protein